MTEYKVLRLPQVIEKVQVGRSSIYLWMKQGTFPKQIKIGPRSAGWLEAEIDDWVESRTQERDVKTQ